MARRIRLCGTSWYAPGVAGRPARCGSATRHLDRLLDVAADDAAARTGAGQRLDLEPASRASRRASGLLNTRPVDSGAGGTADRRLRDGRQRAGETGCSADRDRTFIGRRRRGGRDSLPAGLKPSSTSSASMSAEASPASPSRAIGVADRDLGAGLHQLAQHHPVGSAGDVDDGLLGLDRGDRVRGGERRVLGDQPLGQHGLVVLAATSGIAQQPGHVSRP